MSSKSDLPKLEGENTLVLMATPKIDKIKNSYINQKIRKNETLDVDCQVGDTEAN